MGKETLLADLNRLLDAGEPLLALFPKKYPNSQHNSWPLELPDNISAEMWGYADHVAWRADDRKAYQDYRQQDSTDFLAGLVEDFEVGLLGWRAIGVLK